MPEAVVFDMDGVIVDTEQYWIEEEWDILDAALPAGHDVEPHDITGINVHEQYELLAESHEMQIDEEEYFDRFDQVAERVYERADPMPGLHDLLSWLGSRGIPLGLCTSSYPRWIEIVFETHGLHDVFDVVVSAAELDAPGKPEPDVYLEVADRLDVAPDAMVVIEDSENGIQAAASAGAYTIAYRTDESPAMDHSRADAVVTGSADLRAHLEMVLSSE
ncbi:MAG: HAD family hydrolase [Halodesulfurarchaeum sp.]